ncbi:MAG TPA: Ig-like domain-containing protein, partial [Spirochaetota bacterium]|nr:Ig-like domain-containing protein [Spirochaetota bacterium]
IYNTDKTFIITGDSEAIIQYSFDNGINWINYSGEVTISATGSYYIVAKQKDKAGNESPFTATLNVVLDKINPQVSNVTAIQPNGEYKEGNSIEIKIDFTKAVEVTGSPRLVLNTTPTKYAIYQSGSGASSLSFVYSVSVDDISSRLDYLTINSLELNGGTIKDTVDTGNVASITLAVPGEQKSLGYNKNIKIDGVTPVISSFSPSNLAKNVDKSSNLTITFSEPVYKESGTIDIVRKYKRFPIIVSIDDYNEYISRLSGTELTKFVDSYTLTANGATEGVVSNVAVYVLKYTLDADDADLLSIFDAIGYNKISIDIQSTQVTGSGTDTITINPFDDLPIGVDFYVNISSTAFRDGV